MIAVREVALVDIPSVHIIARRMHEESPAYREDGFDVRKVEAWCNLAVGSRDWFAAIAYRDGEPVGLLAAGNVETLFGHDTTIDDLVFYVAPEARGSTAALRLFRAIEPWAKACGAKRMRFGITTGINEEQARRFYERLGFKTAGLLMVREL